MPSTYAIEIFEAVDALEDELPLAVDGADAAVDAGVDGAVVEFADAVDVLEPVEHADSTTARDTLRNAPAYVADLFFELLRFMISTSRFLAALPSLEGTAVSCVPIYASALVSLILLCWSTYTAMTRITPVVTACQ